MASKPPTKAELRRIDDLGRIRARDLREGLRRGTFAAFFSLYVVFILACIVVWSVSLVVPLRGTIAEIKDMIITLSGVFSGPLGVLLGYLFRGELEGRAVE
jgi:hypothetical protein